MVEVVHAASLQVSEQNCDDFTLQLTTIHAEAFGIIQGLVKQCHGRDIGIAFRTVLVFAAR